MVQQSAPAKTIQKLEGMIMGEVCSPEHGCVAILVRVHAHVDDDGTWFASYWDPENPAHNQHAQGDAGCDSQALARMLNAIADIAPDHP